MSAVSFCGIMSFMKTFCFRLYNSRHNRKLHRLIGIAGQIYNHCIALHKRYYRLYGKYIHKYSLMNHIAKIKRTKRFAFFRKLNAQAVHDVVERIDRAYTLFWNNLKREVRASPPNFRKVKKYRSFTLKQSGYKLNETAGIITIQGQPYRHDHHRRIEGKIKTVTVKRDTLGNIYIFLACDTGAQEVIQRTGESVGFDFGLKKFLTASDGKDIESPQFFRRNAKLIAKRNRALSHKQEGSKRRKRAQRELARIHKRTADQRRDFHYKTALKICREYAVICLEDLNIKGMMKLWGRKISDLAFYSFLLILKYEATKTGTKIVQIDRYYPSSQICSECGYRNAEVKDLHVRHWKCPHCGAEHNRDTNAAKNILRAGASVHAGEPVSHPLKRTQVC